MTVPADDGIDPGDPEDLAGRGGSPLLRLAGLCLLVFPFLPVGLVWGDVPAADARVPPGEWLLGLFVFLTLSWLAALFLPAVARRVRRVGARVLWAPSELTFAVGAGALLAALLILTSHHAFAHRPHLIDSIVQLFQARIFATGSLVAPAPPGEGFFATQHMLVDGGSWYSQYPPGHAALLAAGVLVGLPWIVPIVLSLGTAFLLAAFVRRIYSPRAARLTLVLAAASPFFWFMGASYMNHVSSLFFVALFLLLFARWEEEGGRGVAFSAGLALGGAFLVRPLTGLVVGALFGGIALRRARGRLPALASAAAAFGLCAGVFLLYNALTTGDPLLPGYVKLWGAEHGLGFHATPWGGRHTPWLGLRNEVVDLALLNVYLFEWPVPALLPVGVFLAAGWASRGWDRRLFLGLLAIPAAYLFYWHRDAFLGPRLLYSTLAFLLPLTARALLATFGVLRDLPDGSGPSLTRFRGEDLATFLLLFSFLFAACYAVPRRLDTYATGMASLKRDLSREAELAGIHEGLIFVPVSWGNRMLARMRGLGVPAGVAETVYRRSDHCELEELLRRAEAGAWDGSGTERALRRLIRPPSQLEARPLLNGDPTLRLAPDGRLSELCREELAYDRSGYTVYSPHLAANRPDLDGPLTFARDLRGANRLLLDRYPERRAYLYRGGRFLRLGSGETVGRGTSEGAGAPGAAPAPSRPVGTRSVAWEPRSE